MSDLAARLDAVGAVLIERGWLSCNSIVFAGPEAPATVVDTGYASHADQTVSLVRFALGGKSLDRIVNTHLHSDHCGGNAALQSVFGCEVHVPRACFESAFHWRENQLTFKATGQRCERFRVTDALEPGSVVQFGDWLWEVHACSGHDPESVMLFQSDHRILISGDALWEYRLPITFEAIDDVRGFDGVLSTLEKIEQLNPDVVIPGHGPVFSGSADAIRRSRVRVDDYRSGRRSHIKDAQRSLLMFHFLEHERRTVEELRRWAHGTSIFGQGGEWVIPVATSLVTDQLLDRNGDFFALPARK